MDTGRETIVNYVVVEQHPCCSLSSLVPGGYGLSISRKVISDYKYFLKTPFDLSMERKSRHTISIGAVELMLTSSLLSDPAFRLIQRPQEATLFLMKVSMPGQKHFCFTYDSVLSRPWCPRSSCKAVKMSLRKTGGRTSCKKCCPLSTTLR